MNKFKTESKMKIFNRDLEFFQIIKDFERLKFFSDMNFLFCFYLNFVIEKI